MPTIASGFRLALPLAVIVWVVTACSGETKAMITSAKSPEQPILFMHTVHVDEDSIPCEYCHFSVNTSEEAGIPPVGTCMGCHLFIQGSTPEREAEIQKLRGFFADSTAIPWVRVYSVPSFVQFPHKPHIRKEVECVECHGDVGAMEQVERAVPLTMGWCIDCHRQEAASDDCAACHY